jgi:Putative zinc-finger
MSEKHLDLSSFDQDERGALEELGLRPGSFGMGSECPDPSLLLAAEDGVLDQSIADEVRAHVETCPSCTMLAADLADVFAKSEVGVAQATIRAKVTGAGVSRPPRRLFWGFSTVGLAAAASVLAAVWLAQPVALPQLPGRVQGVRAATVEPPSIFFVEPEDVGPADVELALRGEAPAPAAALPGRPAADEAQWRRAVALVQAGDIAAARSVLNDLCPRPTWRGALACAGLIELDRGRRQ